MSRGTRVWFDIKNSPEVLFFRPILRRLADAGVETTVSSRDFAQTRALLAHYGIPATPIGRHGGGSLLGKGVNLVRRSVAVTWFGRGSAASQTVSIGSNDLSIASRFLGLHNTVIQDYEYATLEHQVNFRLADKVMFPDVVPLDTLVGLGMDPRRYRPIRGIKEQVTLADFEPEAGVLERLGLEPRRPVAVMRPPATMSLYNRGMSSPLIDGVLEHLGRTDTQIVMLPRSPDQAAAYSRRPGVIVPPDVVDGPSLMFFADVVIGAGGSMNREAALLGVPTWTIFAGRMGAVDRMLIDDGRMNALERPEQIAVAKRDPGTPHFEPLADEVTEEILRR
jgi:predicted glycosyltransferase